MVHREIKYVPGFFKIIDEILVNAADNKVSSVHFACGSRDFFLGGGGGRVDVMHLGSSGEQRCGTIQIGCGVVTMYCSIVKE